jgi:hypothetical protein
MAMDGNVLGALMMSKIDALTDVQKANRASVFAELGAAVVEHIQAFAQVSGIVVTVASVSLVTPGVGASGPGTGTGVAPPGSIS